MKYLAFVFSIFLAYSATAADTSARGADIQKIEQYLNNINTLTAPFTQEDSEGGQATGTFYLSRPGKLRWDYDPPTPILIVAKGSLVAYYDKELDQISHVSLDDTMAGVLTRPQIGFSDNGVKILGFVKEKGEMRITITQNKKEDQGSLTMVFKDPQIELERMEVLDSIGKKTIVEFTSLIYNKPLDKELFVLPHVKPKKRD